ncbi:hypothetical protein LR032_03280 [Candidatus Bipolaricaulota bacterium]|nr:hypothetical protein [Candidatus Bipolaricaulota bacterium]
MIETRGLGLKTSSGKGLRNRLGETAHFLADVLVAYKEQHGIEHKFGFLNDPLFVNAMLAKRSDCIEVPGAVWVPVPGSDLSRVMGQRSFFHNIQRVCSHTLLWITASAAYSLKRSNLQEFDMRCKEAILYRFLS